MHASAFGRLPVERFDGGAPRIARDRGDQGIGELGALPSPPQGLVSKIRSFDSELADRQQVVEEVAALVVRELVRAGQHPPQLSEDDMTDVRRVVLCETGDEFVDARRLRGVVADRVPDQYVGIDADHGAAAASAIAASMSSSETDRLDALPAWAASLIEYVESAAKAGEVIEVTSRPRTYTPAEAADRLGLSRPTISRRIAAGEIETIKVGNRHRIPHDELERFWQSTIAATAEIYADELAAP